MILVLHACIPTFGVVIMRHVEPGGERDKERELEIEKDI